MTRERTMAIEDSLQTRLQSDNQIQLLDDMNSLRGLRLQKYVTFPQLVVCGNTSSGKSSVLRSLSGIHFPTSSVIGTRFATELVLTRRPLEQQEAKCSIVASDNTNEEEEQRKYDEFEGTFNLDNVEEVIQRAKTEMGIQANHSSFSNDVLKLEVSGPDLPQLTLIDLPGLIQVNSESTNVDLVKNLTKRYMRAKNTIILAVVSAKDTFTNQQVLALAKKCDPLLERTVGIITKPDELAKDDELRDEYIQLASNNHREFRLTQTWNIVRNRGPGEDEETFQQEIVEDQLFKEPPWTYLSRDQLGLAALRERLFQTQLEHINKSLPKVVQELRIQVESVQEEIRQLGKIRDSPDLQRTYLTDLGVKYDRLLHSKLFSSDWDPPVTAANPHKGLDPMELIVNIRRLTDEFDHDMRRFGHQHQLTREVSTTKPTFLHALEPVRITKRGWLEKINEIAMTHRGRELPGQQKAFMVRLLFRAESEKWQKIAQDYVNAICNATNMFLDQSVRSVCPKAAKTADLILYHVLSPAFEEMQIALNEKKNELLSPYLVSAPWATSPRMTASLEAIEAADKLHGILAPDEEVSGMEQVEKAACIDALLWTRAYYKIAMENFIDSMATLGVENCITRALPDLFSSNVVNALPIEKLETIGGETEATLKKRSALSKDLEKLRHALRTCTRHLSRDRSGAIYNRTGVTGELHGLSTPDELPDSSSNRPTTKLGPKNNAESITPPIQAHSIRVGALTPSSVPSTEEPHGRGPARTTDKDRATPSPNRSATPSQTTSSSKLPTSDPKAVQPREDGAPFSVIHGQHEVEEET